MAPEIVGSPFDRPSPFAALLYVLVRESLPAGALEVLVGKVARGDVGYSDAELLAWCEAQENRLPTFRLVDPAAEVIDRWRQEAEEAEGRPAGT